MGLKRLSLLVLFVLAGAVTLVSAAPAGVGIADEPCPTVSGEHTNTCPPGTVGVPYSIQFREAEGSGCGPGKQTFTVDSGVFPPGLTLETSGIVTGTPTEAGSFTFYIKIAEPQGEDGCQGSVGEKRFTIPINPGQPPVPKLTIGPESAGPGTVGVPYSLTMTANLPDPKTWSIAEGALPPGLTIDATSGLISGTPQAAGSFPFTVLAVIDSARSDTKALAIDVRAPLAIAASDPSGFATAVTRWEVGLPFETTLTATGGTGTYTWALSGSLPRGIVFSVVDGTISGTPRAAGTYRFAVTVQDTENRVATYAGRLLVAPKLAILAQRLPFATVGRLYRAKLRTKGGVAPKTWRVRFGPLPRGMRFDRTLARLNGSPKRPGRYWVMFEVTDALGVTAQRVFIIRVLPSRRA